ncbi:MAG: RNA polymerase sigma factor [Ruminococcus sp.]|nr:RNA polymerase sigma factor [Ruminococcus sp.]
MNDLNEIYELYVNDVFRYLLKLTGNENEAEELTQETFLHAIRKIDTFRGETSIKAWLIVIAKNCYYSAMRSSWKYPAELDDNIQSEKAEDNLSDCFVDRENVRQIHRILHNMQEPYKEVFTLRVFGELPFKEIAELFKKTESWAKVTFYRAKNQILDAINKEDLK